MSSSAEKFTPKAVEAKDQPQKKLRLLMFGQGDGAAKVFDGVRQNHDVVGVVTFNSDTDPLRLKAVESGVPVLDLDQAGKIATRKQMEELEPDYGVAFFLEKILGPKTFSVPRYGTQNLHLSELPKEQGIDAMRWDIYNGNPTLAATIFLMSKKIDAGPIVKQMTYPNPGNKSQGSLYFQHLPER